jgi:hypothetical protein
LAPSLGAQEAPYQNKLWRRLLHLDHSSSLHSYVLNEDFFHSNSADRSLSSEWQGSLKLFQKEYSGPIDKSPQCLFPARFKYINKHLGGKLKQAQCPKLLKWKEFMGVKSVSIVHAAQYIKNPSSFFGHLFLKLNIADHQDSKLNLDTLAHSVNFFADVPADTSSFQYVTKGLFGGFHASFNYSTYAKSLSDYNDLEDRDIWQYQLKLNAAQIDFLLDHLWELAHFGQFGYRFLKDNCAYHILALLEIANESWELTKYFNLYTLPSEGISRLFENDAISNTSYRPSLGTRLRAWARKLTTEQKKSFELILKGEHGPEKEHSTTVLDFSYDFIDYKKHQYKGKLPKSYNVKQQELLQKRSTISESFQKTNISRNPPHVGHYPFRLQASYLNEESNQFALWSARPALHSIVEGAGYPNNFSVEVLNTEIQYSFETHKTKLKNVTIMSAENLRGYEYVDKSFAWSFKTGAGREDQLIWRSSDLNLYAGMSMGLASDEHKALQVYGMLTTSYNGPTNFNRPQRFGLGPSVGVIYRGVSGLSARLSYQRVEALTSNTIDLNKYDLRLIQSINSQNSFEFFALYNEVFSSKFSYNFYF